MIFYFYRLQMIETQLQSFLYSEFRKDDILDRENLLRYLFQNESENRQNNWILLEKQYHDSENVISFKFGKYKTQKKPNLIDNKFIIEEEGVTPFAIIYYDFSLELLLIALQPKVSPPLKSVSAALQNYLNNMEELKKANAKIEIETIFNPENFIEIIKGSKQISKFWFTVKLPNAFDVNKLIMKPLEQTLQPISANHARVEFTGKDLNKNAAEDITRSAATKGLKAGATIKRLDTSKPENIKINNNVVTMEIKDSDASNIVIDNSRKLYYKIRNG